MVQYELRFGDSSSHSISIYKEFGKIPTILYSFEVSENDVQKKIYSFNEYLPLKTKDLKEFHTYLIKDLVYNFYYIVTILQVDDKSSIIKIVNHNNNNGLDYFNMTEYYKMIWCCEVFNEKDNIVSKIHYNLKGDIIS